MTPRKAKLFGMLGILCLQTSTLPALWQAIRTGESAPIATLLLITLGMVFCIIQEYHAKLWAYVLGSAVTIVGHIAIVLVVLYR
jgi:hypothetical protein